MNIELIQKQLIDQFPRPVLEMVTGKLLGDGNITIENGKKGRFRFGHGASDKSWCFHCYHELKAYFPLSPPKYRVIKDKRTNLEYKQFYVQSKTNDRIEHLKHCWYENKKKRLPPLLIDSAMSPLCLAWWYQDDGHLKISNGVPKKVILSTDSFSAQELAFLQQLLYRKFHFDFHSDGQNRLIMYNKPSIYYFLHMIRPYMIEGMSRKNFKPTPPKLDTFPYYQRTTIALPSFISISRPTKQIQNALKQLPALAQKLKNDENYQKLFRTWMAQSKTWNADRKPYQIQIPQKALFYLEWLHVSTGLQKSECAALCFLDL